jgi:2-dehydropantoate 2-reductase
VTRIAVVGTGANGSCVSADLVGAGQDVVLIDQWPAHVEAMRADGLRITVKDEEIRVPVRAHHVCDLCTLNERFDLVLVLAKAYDTRWSCELIKPYLTDQALVIGMQNAMTAETIAEIVGPSRTLGCVVELSSQSAAPGHVHRNTPPSGSWFAVGSFHPSTAGREREVEDILKHVGKVEFRDDILSAKWMKLIVNSMTMGPQSILGLGSRAAMAIPEMRQISLQAGAEALAVGQRRGYTLQPIFGLRRDEIEGSNRLLEVLLDKLLADVGPNGRATVLYDHDNGRYSEVDQINGLVAEYGVEFGIATPMNDKVVEITRRIHAGEIKHEPDNLRFLVEALND